MTYRNGQVLKSTTGVNKLFIVVDVDNTKGKVKLLPCYQDAYGREIEFAFEDAKERFGSTRLSADKKEVMDVIYKNYKVYAKAEKELQATKAKSQKAFANVYNKIKNLDELVFTLNKEAYRQIFRDLSHDISVRFIEENKNSAVIGFKLSKRIDKYPHSRDYEFIYEEYDNSTHVYGDALSDPKYIEKYGIKNPEYYFRKEIEELQKVDKKYKFFKYVGIEKGLDFQGSLDATVLFKIELDKSASFKKLQEALQPLEEMFRQKQSDLLNNRC